MLNILRLPTLAAFVQPPRTQRSTVRVGVFISAGQVVAEWLLKPPEAAVLCICGGVIEAAIDRPLERAPAASADFVAPAGRIILVVSLVKTIYLRRP